MPRRSSLQSDADARATTLFTTPALVRHGFSTVGLYRPPGDVSQNTSDSEQVNSTSQVLAEVSNSTEPIGRVSPSAKETQLAELEGLIIATQHMDTSPSERKLAVKKAALTFNNVLKDLGTTDDQLSVQLLRAADVSENSYWLNFKPDFLTPTRLARVMSGAAAGDAAYLGFSGGTWANKYMSYAESRAFAGKPDWIFTITSVFVEYERTTQKLTEWLEQARKDPGAYSPDRVALSEATHAALFSDYWSLNLVLTFHQYMDERQQSYVPYLDCKIRIVADQFNDIACKIGLTWEQLRACRLLWEHVRDEHTELQMACYAANLLEWNGLVPEQLIKQAGAEWDLELRRRILEVQVVSALLFEILSPLQSAKFVTLVRIFVDRSICQWKEWMRLIYPCIAGQDQWMDKYEALLLKNQGKARGFL